MMRDGSQSQEGIRTILNIGASESEFPKHQIVFLELLDFKLHVAVGLYLQQNFMVLRALLEATICMILYIIMYQLRELK